MDMTGVTCSSTLWELNMHGKMLIFRTYSKRPKLTQLLFRTCSSRWLVEVVGRIVDVKAVVLS